MLSFKTDDNEIIQMYNDYLFLKYYKTNIIEDMESNLIKLYPASSGHDKDEVLEIIDKFSPLYNNFEYSKYKSIVNKFTQYKYPISAFEYMFDTNVTDDVICKLKWLLLQYYKNNLKN